MAERLLTKQLAEFFLVLVVVLSETPGERGKRKKFIAEAQSEEEK